MKPPIPVILCVDDEEANLKLLENILVPRGFAVVGVANGEDALRKIESQAIDLVLLDVIMPGMDGFEVCRRIKRDPKSKNIPVILVTALTAKQDHVRGIEAGAEEFLAKPIETTVALARIKILLRLKELSDEGQRAGQSLKKSHDELERVVKQRTAELVKANEMLKADIAERIRTEEALRESEKKFRDIFENVLDVYFETAMDGTILEISPSIQMLSNGQHHRDELIGKPMKDYYSDSKMRQSLIEVLRERENILDYEIELKNRDGSLIPCAISAKIHFEAQGDPEKILGTVRDISERKQAEAALNAISTHQEALLSSVPDLIMETDTNKLYTWANSAGLEFFGTDVIGKEASFYFCGEQNTYEVVEPLFRGDERVIYVESRQRRRDGEKRLLAWWSRVLKDGSGNVIGVVSSARDITERKQAEQALTVSEDKFRKIFFTSPDALSITCLENGLYISINPGFTRTTGYTEKDIIGKTAIEAKIWDNIGDRQKLLDGLRKNGEVTNLGVAFKTKGNDLRYGLMSATIIDLGGAPYILSIIRDVTEQKQAEGKIINSLAEKEILLKEVHHRVKNNLMIIIGLIKMQGLKADTEMLYPLLLELEGRIRSMALVHENLYKSADLAHIDLQNYIEQMSALICAQFGEKNDIRLTVRADGVEVGLDIAVPCGLILNEMLVNAYKHAFPGGKTNSGKGNCEIVVTVKHEGDILSMTVADNGVGQPVDVDIENPQTLGLRLIKMLSQQIGGSLEMGRTAGTVYRLKFPRTVP